MLRALLILLSLMLAAPVAAMPACHEEASTAAMTHGPGKHHRMPDTAPPHACFGCIPPADWIAPPLPAPRLAPALPPAARALRRLDLGRAPPPLLRPPRFG